MSRGYSPVAVRRPLTGAASLVAGHGLQGTWASVVSACGLRSRGSWAPEHSSHRAGA